MDRRNLGAVLRHAATVAGRDTAAARPDGELLRRFHRDRDDAAFAELVRRYGRLVWAVCRHLVPSDADAEDAFQATFLALVRSAGSIRSGAALGPWLHGVAVRVCSKARRSSTRRKQREQTAGASGAGRAVPDSAWDSALAAVHEEVARLPDSLRVPFVLCCLEGTGATEAAERLGWKLGTLSGRLTRAKQTLLARLDARGLSAGAIAAAAVTGGATTAGVSAAVFDRVTELVQPGVTVPGSITYLSQGVVGMGIHRTKLLAAAVLISGGLATTAGTGWVTPAGAQTPAQSGKPADPAAKAAPKAAIGSDETVLQDLAKKLARLQAEQAKPTIQSDKADVASLLAALLRSEEKPETKGRGAKAAKWVYHYLPQLVGSGLKQSEFESLVAGTERDGWEFVGTVSMKWASTLGGEPKGDAGVTLPTLVFRRPAGQTAADTEKLRKYYLDLKAAQPSADAVREIERMRESERAAKDRVEADARVRDLAAQMDNVRKQQDELQHRRAEVAARDAVKAANQAAAAREAELRAEIERLRAELAKRAAALGEPTPEPGSRWTLKEDGERTARFSFGNAATGLTLDELASVLVAMAKTKFPAAKLSVTFDRASHTVSIRGPAEVVTYLSPLGNRMFAPPPQTKLDR